MLGDKGLQLIFYRIGEITSLQMNTHIVWYKLLYLLKYVEVLGGTLMIHFSLKNNVMWEGDSHECHSHKDILFLLSKGVDKSFEY